MAQGTGSLDDAGIDARREAARAIVADAASLALAFWRDLGSLTVTRKGLQDVVSEADVRVEEHIRAALAEAFPEDSFLGEETGHDALDEAAAVWVVDPIDGTQPFLLGLPTWGVSVALVSGGVIVLGFLACPAAGETYEARLGAGATLNGAPIRVREATSLEDGLTTLGYSRRTTPQDASAMLLALLEGGGMFHRCGSGAVGLAYVAAGRMIGYVEEHINSWDCLAAILLVTEAGGRASDFLGRNGLTGGGPLVAGSPGVYDALLALLPRGA